MPNMPNRFLLNVEAWRSLAAVTVPDFQRLRDHRTTLPTRLTGLFIYPVKSCGGIALDEAEVDDFGLRGDRRWMVVDGAGSFLSQRKHPRLALVTTRIEADALHLAAPGMPTLTVPLEPCARIDPDSAGGDRSRLPPPGRAQAVFRREGRQEPGDTADAIIRSPGEDRVADHVRVRVWRDTVEALTAGREAAAWFSAHLGIACRLVHMPPSGRRAVPGRWGTAGQRVSFADAYPFLLIGRASLDDLNSRLAEPVPMNRFRPNLVIDGAAPYAEDGWRMVRIGEIQFDVAKPCLRCIMTTIDQATARGGKEPLATLARYRRAAGTNGVAFGQNLVHSRCGVLRVGDPVET